MKQPVYQDKSAGIPDGRGSNRVAHNHSGIADGSGLGVGAELQHGCFSVFDLEALKGSVRGLEVAHNGSIAVDAGQEGVHRAGNGKENGIAPRVDKAMEVALSILNLAYRHAESIALGWYGVNKTGDMDGQDLNSHRQDGG